MASSAHELTPRAREIVAAARELLEAEGPQGLSMRRVAERVGIRAPSIYKHLPDKEALEAALISAGLEEWAQAFRGETPEELGRAYRAYALAHPHLYRLMTERPLAIGSPPGWRSAPRSRSSTRSKATPTPRAPCGPSPTG